MEGSLMTTAQVVWQEPPAPETGRSASGKYNKVIEALKENPNKWALIRTTATPTTLTKAFGGSDFERAYRVVRNGNRKVYQSYARYIGKSRSK